MKRRQQIIASAARVFGESGYAGGSLRQIARRVGVTPTALSRHFEDKESLLLAVLQYWDSENDRLVPRRLRGIERVKQMPESARQHTHDRGLVEMFLTVAAEASNPVHPLHDVMRRRYSRVIGAMVAEVAYAAEIGELLPTMTDDRIACEVRAAYAVMDGIQLQWLLDPSWDLVAAFRGALDHFIESWTGEPVIWDAAGLETMVVVFSAEGSTMSKDPGPKGADVPAPKTRGPYRNGIKRRREIILAASRVFGQYGYAGGSLRQIAVDVGVTPAALTRHFDSKEGLLIAVLENWDAENDRVIPASVRGLARFMMMPYNAYQHTLDRGLIEMFLTIAAEASNPSHPLHQFVKDRYDRLMARAVTDLRYAAERGEILPMDDAQMMREVRAAYALMDGVQLQWLLNSELDLLKIFQGALGHFIERWTGKPVVWLDPRVTAAAVEVDRAL